MESGLQYIDPKITHEKFNQELDKFYHSKEIFRKRGIFLLEAEFPNINFAFSVPNLKPSPIGFAVRINFDNFDFEAPSVIFIDPFTFEPIINENQIGVSFLRKVENSAQFQKLVQQNNGKLPFICIPGIREYHKHPAHTGDSWFLHRGIGGEGSLGFILDKLYEYGIEPIAYYQAVLNFNGLSLTPDPNKIPL